MQRKHCGPEEATWELEDAMQLTHSLLVQFLQRPKGGVGVVLYFVKLLSTEGSPIQGGWECNTLIFYPVILNFK